MGSRFNIEAANKGLNCYPDDYYRTGRYQITPILAKKGCFLQSKTPKEELASFLAERYFCWRDLYQYRPATEAMAWARALVPENAFFFNTLKRSLNEWVGSIERRKPPEFPGIQVFSSQRRFPQAFPWEIERHILGLDAAENLLNNPEYKHQWWDPLRKGLKPSQVPTQARLDFHSDGCSVRFQFPPSTCYSFQFGGIS